MPVLIMSGGIDSTTLLWYLMDRYDDIHVLTFIYGQRHVREVEHAKVIVEKAREKAKIYHKIADISCIHDLIAKGALTGDENIPEGFYTDDIQKVTIVPNRNMILLAVAVGYAVKVGEKEVYYAAHKSDYAIYPDCRKEFVKALDTAVYLATIFDPVEIKAPFVDMTKADVVKLGLKLGVPYELTWSCYRGEDRPCLKCGTCLERTEAFLMNGVNDPALSDEEWKKAVEIYERIKSGNK
ncbi:7-cyano-7-deazaguanine synthase QueC [Archaeoglobus sp.]